MAYVQIFNAIQTSWTDLYDCLLETQPLTLYNYVRNKDQYLYTLWIDLAYNDFNDLLEYISYDNKTKDLDIELIPFLHLVRSALEAEGLMDEELIIENKLDVDSFSHCTSDETIRDIEDEDFKRIEIRRELEVIATGMNLRNYKIRTFLLIDTF